MKVRKILVFGLYSLIFFLNILAMTNPMIASSGARTVNITSKSSEMVSNINTGMSNSAESQNTGLADSELYTKTIYIGSNDQESGSGVNVQLDSNSITPSTSTNKPQSSIITPQSVYEESFSALIWTDKADYNPEEIVTIFGSGFDTDTSIEVNVTRPNEVVETGYATSNSLGEFIYYYTLDGILGQYNVTATDGINYADTTFFDSNIDFMQYADIDDNWIGSILSSSNSLYREGMSVPQRIILNDIKSTPGNVHTLTFNVSFTKNGIHGYDWLTGWNQGNDPLLAFDPCGVNFIHTTQAVCQYLYYTPASFIMVDVPDDPFLSKDDGDPLLDPENTTQGRINAYESVYGNRQINITGNSAISSPVLEILHDVSNYGDSGDSYIGYTLTWTSASTKIMIQLAGHLAMSGAKLPAWGDGLGASYIPGGSYHFKLDEIDQTSLGSQDNQIKSGAILPADSDLSIVKDGPATALVGETITYTFTVTNNGPSSAIDVVVNDNLLGLITMSGLTDEDGDLLLDDLANGAVAVGTKDYIIPTPGHDPVVNTVLVTSTTPDTDTSNNQDGHSVDVLRTGVSIVKTGPDLAHVGDEIIYTITIENKGEVDLYITSLYDPLLGGEILNFPHSGDFDPINVLNIGEIWVYSIPYTILATDLDPLFNEVVVTGQNYYGKDGIQASSTWNVDILNPLISLTKIATDGFGTEISTAYIGDTITYTFDVENTGDSDLTGISITDITGIIEGSLVRGSDKIGNNDNILEPGEIWVYTGTHLVTLDDSDPLYNLASVSGTDALGKLITASDDATVDILHYAGSLTVTKTGPDTAYHGELVTYTIQVSYSSPDNSPAYITSVSDDLYGPALYVSGDTDQDGLLDVGEIWMYTVSGTFSPSHTDGEIDPVVNTVTVTGTDYDGDGLTPAQATHDTDILHYAGTLTVTKTGPDTAYHGESVSYDIAVSYFSIDNSPAHITSILDDLYGPATYVSGDADNDGLLDVGEIWMYTVSGTFSPSHADGEDNPVVNTVDVTGFDYDGDGLTPAQASHDTYILHPEGVLTVTKTGPDSAHHGESVTYDVAVSYYSTDNSPAYITSIVDDLYGSATYVSGDADQDGLLDVGEIWMYTVSGTFSPSHTDGEIDPVVNTVTVTGTDYDGDGLTPAQATHDTDILHYAGTLTVTKTGPDTAYHGESVSYDIAVSYFSIDNSPAHITSILDDLYGPATYVSGDADNDGLLDVGETWMYTVSGTFSPTHVDGEIDPVVNTVTVTGTDFDGDGLTPAQATHDTDILHYAGTLTVTKTGPDTAYHGEAVTYDIAISYYSTDNSPAYITSIVDDLYGSAIYVSGDVDNDGLLDVGETWMYTVSGTFSPNHADGEIDPIVNTVTVTGTDYDGDGLTPTQATHDTDILHPEGILTVTKTGQDSAYHGEIVFYDIAVSYFSTDNSPALINSVVDDLYGAATYVSGDTDNDGLLDVGEIWMYTVSGTFSPSHADGEDNPVVNTVDVTGFDYDGDGLTPAQASHDTYILHPEGILTITKTGPDTAYHGESVTYDIAVSYYSTDNSPALIFSVVDDLYGSAIYVSGDVDNDGLLDVGEIWMYTVSGTFSPTHADGEVDPVVNTVTVMGYDYDGDGLTPAQATHDTDILHLEGIFTVTKTGPDSAHHGESVIYDIAVSYYSLDNSPALIDNVVDDLYGSATYVSGDTDNDGLLDVGEIWMYTVSGTFSPSHADDEVDPVVNTVTVTGTDYDGDGLTPAQATHDTDILHYEGIITVTKTGPDTAYHGESVTYDIAVSYYSLDNSPAYITSIIDDLYGSATYVSGDADNDGLLDVGETWMYTVSGTFSPSHTDGEVDPVVNTVTVTGFDFDGDGLTPAQATHDTDILHYAGTLTVTKTGPDTAYHGETVTYDIAISYYSTDNSPAYITSIVDDLYGSAIYVSGDADNDGLLDVGETWMYTVSGTFSPTHADDEVDPVVNTVTVTGTDYDGDGLTPTQATHDTDILHPEGILTVTKTGPDTAYHGESVTYDIAVSYYSTDNSPAHITSVVDDLYGAATYVSGDTDSDGLLDVGETWMYTVSGTFSPNHADGEADPVVNTVTVTGFDHDGDALTPAQGTHDTDILHYSGILTVTKTGPDTAYHGEVVTYDVAVSYYSTDNSPAHITDVVDDLYGAATYVSGDTDNDGLLDVGETWMYTVSGTFSPNHVDDEIDPVVNTVTVTGFDYDGDGLTPAQATHDTDILHPEGILTVTKTGPDTAYHGESVTYDIAVSYYSSDNSPALIDSVVDDLYGSATYVSGDADNDGLLDVGETWMYTVSGTFSPSHTDGEVDPVANTVTVKGFDYDGDGLTPAQATHDTDILHPEGIFTITKTGPDTAYHGESVTYDIAVSYYSIDNSPALIFSVVDDLYGSAIYVSGDSDNDGLLDVGETWMYTVSGTFSPSHTDGEIDPVVNTVTVTGFDYDGDGLTPAQATHDTDILHLEGIFTVTKTGPDTAYHGETVSYDIAVSYYSLDNSPAHITSVVDDLYGSATYVSGDVDNDGLLDVGEIWMYTVSGTFSPSHADGEVDPIVNTVTVTGTDYDGDGLTPAQATHDTDILHLEGIFTITKTGPDTAYHGESVTYDIAVSYYSTDNSPALIDSVVDDLYGAATYVSGDTDQDGLLDVGEIWMYTVSGTFSPSHTDGEIDPVVNTVTVTGFDYDGDGLIPAQATHDTDILHLEGIFTITKTGPDTAYHGESVTYTIEVSYYSSDNSPALIDSVVDDLYGPATYVSGDTDNDGLLDVGETWMYTVSGTLSPSHADGEVDPVVNTVTVKGFDYDGDGLTPAQATHDTDILHPEGILTVTKTGPDTAYHGESVTYDIAVSYYSTDNSPAYITSIVDDLYGSATYVSGDSDNDGLLDVGETWMYTVSGTFSPSHTDGEIDPVVNTVTVTGTDYDGDALSPAQTTHDTDILHPEGTLTVVKTGSDTAYHGETVTYDIAVSYFSIDNSPAHITSVIDDLYGPATYVSGDSDNDGLLDVGETWMYTVSGTFSPTHTDNEVDPVVNTVTVTGTDYDNDGLTPAQATHDTDILHPEGILTVTKTGQDSAYHGDIVTYDIAVSYYSTDNSPAHIDSVIDDLYGSATYVSGDTDNDGLLDVGETWMYTVSGTFSPSHADDELDPVVNTVTVKGFDHDSDELDPAQTTHSTNILHKEGILSVVKTGPTSAYHGEIVNYDIAVSYYSTDNSPAHITDVVDDLYGPAIYISGDTDNDGLLDVGETWMYTVSGTFSPSHADNELDPVVNTVTVTGTDYDGDGLVPVQATHDTDILHPEGILTVTKSGPDSAHHGELVSYTIQMSYYSSDNSPAHIDSVIDNLYGAATYVSGDTDQDGLLDVGETWMYTVSGTFSPSHIDGETDPVINTVTVTGFDHDGDDLTPGTDNHVTDILHPAISVIKTGPSVAELDETVIYYYTVTNIGDTPLYDVLLSDNIVGPITLSGLTDLDGDGVADDLDIEASAMGQFSYTIVSTNPDPLINTATVVGFDKLGLKVESTATHTINIFHVDITVCKYIDTDGLLTTTDDLTPYTNGWKVYLYKNGELIDTQITGADGCFTWEDLGHGNYLVAEEEVSGWTPITPISNNFGSVNDGQTYKFDFINFQWLKISGHKYFDYDRTKPTDKPIEGWIIELYNNNVLYATASTDASGYYEFLVKDPGSYTIHEILITGWSMTHPSFVSAYTDGLDHSILGYDLGLVSSGIDIENMDFWNILITSWMSDTSDQRIPVTDFRIVFSPDLDGCICYKISATNPGGFYYNFLVPAGSAYGSITYILPSEFSTQGAKPVHAYIWTDLDHDNEIDYWVELTDISNSMTVDLANNNLALSNDIASGEYVLFTIHVTYNLKGTGDYNFDQANAFDNSEYTFGIDIDHLVDWYSETTLTAHARVKEIKGPSVYGLVLDKTNEDSPIKGVSFKLTNSKGRTVESFTTDEYGFYLFDHLKEDTYILEIEVPFIILYEGSQINLILSISIQINLKNGDFIQVSINVQDGKSSIESNPSNLPTAFSYTSPINGTIPMLTDTDGDGINDNTEINIYGTDPLLADTDGDGLNDGAEINIYGTDPLLADTDGDGLNDGYEVNVMGTNPLDPLNPTLNDEPTNTQETNQPGDNSNTPDLSKDDSSKSNNNHLKSNDPTFQLLATGLISTILLVSIGSLLFKRRKH